MISKNAYCYCKEDISLVENYDKAKEDLSCMWHCHHRLEELYSTLELKSLGQYYWVPASALIFLHPDEHRKTFHMGRCRKFLKKKSEMTLLSD